MTLFFRLSLVEDAVTTRCQKTTYAKYNQGMSSHDGRVSFRFSSRLSPSQREPQDWARQADSEQGNWIVRVDDSLRGSWTRRDMEASLVVHAKYELATIGVYVSQYNAVGVGLHQPRFAFESERPTPLQREDRGPAESCKLLGIGPRSKPRRRGRRPTNDIADIVMIAKITQI